MLPERGMKMQKIETGAAKDEEVVIVIRNGSVVHFVQREVEKATAGWWSKDVYGATSE